MRMACETPAPATGGLVLELKAQGHDEGKDTFEKRLPIQQGSFWQLDRGIDLKNLTKYPLNKMN